jgi:hypothetical protein
MKKVLITLFFLASYFFSYAQNAHGYVLTDPLNNGENQYNISLQFQAPQLSQWALTGAFSHQINNKVVDDFTISSESKTQGISLKYFPYGKRIVGFKKEKRYPDVCDAKYGCNLFGKHTPLINKILRGGYFAAGYEYRRTHLLLTPIKGINDPNSHQFILNNKAITLATGFQIQVSAFVFGMGYNASIGKPEVEGGYKNLQKDLISYTFPLAFRFEHGLHLDLGFSF